MERRNVMLLFLFGLSFVSASNIFEIFTNSGAELREDNDRTCMCKGPGCMCCVDFNFTYIHLGGPGCVQMEYVSQEEGISVNVSYGDRILHAQQVKGPNPPPTCMTLVKNIAEICARFTSLEKHDEGLRGCLVIEPKVLKDIQTQFDVSCFVMGRNGMKIDNNSTAEENSTEEVEENSTEQGETEVEDLNEEFNVLNEEAIFAAVSETAQKGLAFFSNFLGIDLNSLAANVTGSKGANKEKNETDEEEEEEVETATETS